MPPPEAPGEGPSCLSWILGAPAILGLWLLCLVPASVLTWLPLFSVCSLLSLIRTLSQDLGPPQSSLKTLNLHAQRSFFQMKSLSQVSGVRTRTFHFEGSSPTINSHSKAPSCTEIVEVVDETVPSHLPGKQSWSVGAGRRGWKMCLQVWAWRRP